MCKLLTTNCNNVPSQLFVMQPDWIKMQLECYLRFQMGKSKLPFWYHGRICHLNRLEKSSQRMTIFCMLHWKRLNEMVGSCLGIIYLLPDSGLKREYLLVILRWRSE